MDGWMDQPIAEICDSDIYRCRIGTTMKIKCSCDSNVFALCGFVQGLSRYSPNPLAYVHRPSLLFWNIENLVSRVYPNIP